MTTGSTLQQRRQIALPNVLLIMAFLLPKLLRCGMVIECIATAFIFYAIHTLIDSTQEPRTTHSVR